MEQYQDKNGIFQLARGERTAPCEAVSDFTLPDYHSEISRLLLVRPVLTPPECFLRSNRAELSGTARYEILYAGPDGALYGTVLSDGYHFTLPLESGEGEGVLLPQCCVEAVVARVTGPRRLSIRTRVGIHVSAYATETLTLQSEGCEKREALCMLCDTLNCGRVIKAERETLSLTDSVECEEDVRIIAARGCAFVPEASAGNDRVLGRGEAIVTLLLCREEGIPYTVQRRIPFSFELAATGAAPFFGACASATVCELSTAIENGRITIEVSLTLTGEAQGEEETVILRDVLLPQHKACTRPVSHTAFRAALCQNKHVTVTGEAAFPAKDREIIDVYAEAEIGEKCADGVKITLSGELKCHVLYHAEGDFGTEDVGIPFRIVLDEACEELSLSHSVPLCRATLTDRALRVDAELQLALRATSPLPVHTLSEVSFTPCEEKRDENVLELYYPTKEETLWDVAKRYGCSPEALADANGISAEAPGSRESLDGRKFLLLP